MFAAGVLPAPVCRAVHRQSSRHDGGLQQLPGVRLCHQGDHEDQGTLGLTLSAVSVHLTSLS